MLVSLGINAAMLLIFLSIYTPHFHSNDDFTLMRLADGSWGFHEHRLLYINVVTGLLLKGLYSLLPGVSWYTVLQYFCIFSSFSALCYVLLRRWMPLPALAAALTLLYVFALDAYIAIHYTKTAAILTVSGLFLMFHARDAEEGKVRLLTLAVGIVMALFGLMYRHQQFFACGFLCCFIVADQLIPLIPRLRRSLKEGLKAGFVILRPFMLLLALAAGLLAVESLAFSSPELAYYREYTNARMAWMDYGSAPYEGHEQEYGAVGVSGAYYPALLEHYLDPDILSPDCFEAMSELRENAEPQPSLSDILKSYAGYIKELLSYRVAFGLVVLGVLWLVFGRHDRAALAGMICAGLAFAGVSLLLCIRGRYNYWTSYGWLLAAASVTLWYTPRQAGQWSKRSAALCTALLLLFSVWGMPSRSGMLSNEATADERLELEQIRQVAETAKAQELLVLSSIQPFYLYRLESPFDTDSAIVTENVFYLGGWEFGHPSVMAALESRGMTNPYRDCIDKENVLFCTKDIQLIMNFIRDEYHPSAKAVSVSDPGSGYGLYRIAG